MNRGRRIALAVALSLLAGGCPFDSLVTASCDEGFVSISGQCQPSPPMGLPDGSDAAIADAALDDAAVDDAAGADGAPADADELDAALDAAAELMCDGDLVACAGRCVDLTSDPDHCGACGLACESGLCTASVCAGAVFGHIVAIGHDYDQHHAGNARLLANAVSLAGDRPARIMVWRGDATLTAYNDVVAALTTGMSAAGQAWQSVAAGAEPPDDRSIADVVLIAPQREEAATQLARGAAWATRFDEFTAAGGVVVGLAGPSSTTMDLLRGAALFDATSGTACTGAQLRIADATDAIAIGVPSPYLGTVATTTFTTSAIDTSVVIATSSDEPVVLHRTVAVH